jgi:hypothetical protein
MEGNFDGAINKLQEMLATDEGKKNLENVMGTFSGGIAAGNPSGITAEGGGADILSTAQNFMGGMQDNDSPHSNLLRALKPYLSETRHTHVDTAIQLMSLTKIPGMMKLFRK